jgi:hypothetical protein
LKFEIRNLRFVLPSAGLLLLAGCGKPVEPLPPDRFTAQAVLSTNAILVGDSVTLTLTARHPAGSTVTFPTIGNGKEIAVRGRSQDSKKLSESVLETEESYQLTSFRIGDWNLATNPAVCSWTNGVEKTQALPELTLHVQSSLNETNATKLSDIKDIVKPPLRLSRILPVVLAVALLALIAGLITLLLLRKKKQTALQAAPPLPPHVIARQALENLKAKGWSPEPFFTELSRILRTYLEDRFDLNAPESTTEELTRSMAHDGRLNIKEQQTLRNFMTQADLVKFARAGAEKEVMQTAFSTVAQFVDQTAECPTPNKEPQNEER